MNKKLLIIMLSALAIISTLIVACSGTTSSTSTKTSPAATQSSSSTTAVATTSSATTSTGNWWDKWGEPEYGGTITSLSAMGVSAYNAEQRTLFTYMRAPVFDNLFINDWTVDPDEWFFIGGGMIPLKYWEGQIAESWEQTDPTTFTVRIKQGIHFQDKEPTNGRELTADDVVFNYDVIMGTGAGFTDPSPFWISMISNLEKVTAVDQYTVQFKMKNAGALAIFDLAADIHIAAPELEQIEGAITDWTKCSGTGPWILSDWQDNVSFTVSANKNYWGYDERHPENKLPYADNMKFLNLQDKSAIISALRTYKIDVLYVNPGITISDMESIKRTTPDINWRIQELDGQALVLRISNAPFTDIKVRKAMQMAINLPELAKVHYGGLTDGTPCGVANPINTDFVLQYEDWPADLQAEYTYNPEQAKQLLTEAGYPNGFETECLAGSSSDLELVQILQNYLSQVNIKMNITTMDGSALGPMLFEHKFDQMAIFQLCSRQFAPWQELSYFTPGTSLNLALIDDAEYNAMYKQLETVASIEEAQEICKDLMEYSLRQHWLVTTFSFPVPLPIQSYIGGSSAEQSSGYPFARWWVNQEAKSSLTK